MRIISASCHIESNGTHDIATDADGKPLEGTIVLEDGIIRRFRGGLLDGDSYTQEGKLLTQPAIEGPGHLEYWREGCLHRDDGLPALSSKGFTRKEWWTAGKFIKKETSNA
jgi:hypothetical protein